jgi:hypothetical protein
VFKKKNAAKKKKCISVAVMKERNFEVSLFVMAGF